MTDKINSSLPTVGKNLRSRLTPSSATGEFLIKAINYCTTTLTRFDFAIFLDHLFALLGRSGGSGWLACTALRVILDCRSFTGSSELVTESAHHSIDLLLLASVCQVHDNGGENQPTNHTDDDNPVVFNPFAEVEVRQCIEGAIRCQPSASAATITKPGEIITRSSCGSERC